MSVGYIGRTSWDRGAWVATSIAQLASRVAARERGAGLAVGHGVAPASVAGAVVFSHLVGSIVGYHWKSRVVVWVVAIILDFLPTGLLVVLSLLTLTPKEETGDDQEGDNDDWNDNSNGCFTAGTETT